MLCMLTNNIKTNLPAWGAGKVNEGKTYNFLELSSSYMSSLTPFAQIALSLTIERAKGKRMELREMQRIYNASIEKQVQNVVEYYTKCRRGE